jgi:uncharacterized protein (TIGR02246 family)
MVWTSIKPAFTALLLVMFLPVILSAQKQTLLTDSDSAAIRQVIAGFADSYNRHNAQDLAKWFTQDADFTTARGVTTHGRTQIEEHFATLFAGRLKDVHREVSVRSTRLLTPEVVSVNIDCEVTGTKGTDGSELPAHKGLYDWILTKQDGRWLINVFHESDLPLGPASPSP